MICYDDFNINDNLLDQMSCTMEFIETDNSVSYPDSVPYFKVISKKTYKTKNSQINISPQEYQHHHLQRIGEQVECEILDGNHFIYYNNYEKIAEITDKFLKSINK